MHLRWDESQRDKFYQLVQTRTGLLLDVHRRKDLSTLIGNLFAADDHAHHPETLLEWLASQPVSEPVWQRVIHTITVGETYFFRNEPQFNALRSEVLPALISERRASGIRQLRIWSAGCATGEEPYSLAIMLRELISDIDSWTITLLATDINETFLDEARQGLYRTKSFRNETPEVMRNRWFTAASGGYQLDHSVRNMVLFKPLNLVSDAYPTYESNTMHMDVILCRNVTIYFDRETTRQVASRFQKALIPGGWLIVGHSEPQADLYEGFAVRNFENTVFYHREKAHSSKREHASVKHAVPELPEPLKTLPPVRPLPSTAPAESEKHARSRTSEECWTLARKAADLEHWDESRSWLEKAEKLNRFLPQVHYLRGLIEQHSGNADAAFASLRRALYCDPNFVLAHYTLGECYLKRGSQREAKRHWLLARTLLSGLDAQVLLPFTEDLTVEMLNELVMHRLEQL